MSDLSVFDSVCILGRHRELKPGGPHTADDLLGAMDRHGIAEALVLDCLSRENHPADGNERVLSAAAVSPRLHPAWALLPTGEYEGLPRPRQLVRRMRDAGVGAAFLFSGQYKISLADWAVDELLEPLAEHRVPLFINPNDLADPRGWDAMDWDAVVSLCCRHPDLPVIASEWRIRRAQRMIYRALDACPNLRIELSGYWLYRGIEFITERWGARRLVFGSNWPTFGQAMTLAPLACADISESDKGLIAGGNLRKLLSWHELDSAEPKPPSAVDRYVEFGRTGKRPAEMRFADCHGHLGGRMAHYHVPGGDLDSTVVEMERLGVDVCCVFSIAGVLSDESFGNDIVADAVRRYPDRFVGFALLNPHRGRDGMLAELERCEKLGLRGIKLIAHYQGHSDEGDWLDVPCEWAHDRGWIILNHHWGSPAQVERLVSGYPSACFITGHATAAYADTMRRHPNLFVCSCPLLAPRDCEDLVRVIGADRLLFGSDLQDLPIAWGLGPILFSYLREGDKDLILGDNLRGILKKYSIA